MCVKFETCIHKVSNIYATMMYFPSEAESLKPTQLSARIANIAVNELAKRDKTVYFFF